MVRYALSHKRLLINDEMSPQACNGQHMQHIRAASLRYSLYFACQVDMWKQISAQKHASIHIRRALCPSYFATFFRSGSTLMLRTHKKMAFKLFDQQLQKASFKKRTLIHLLRRVKSAHQRGHSYVFVWRSFVILFIIFTYLFTYYISFFISFDCDA